MSTAATTLAGPEDLEFTRTANGVSELGKDRLRAVPPAARSAAADPP